MKQGEYEFYNHLPKFDRMEGIFNNSKFTNEHSEELGLGRVSFLNNDLEIEANHIFNTGVAGVRGNLSNEEVMDSPINQKNNTNIGHSQIEDIIVSSKEELINKTKKREN